MQLNLVSAHRIVVPKSVPPPIEHEFRAALVRFTNGHIESGLSRESAIRVFLAACANILETKYAWKTHELQHLERAIKVAQDLAE